MGEDFNKKILRGSRVIRIKENIENAIMAVESMKDGKTDKEIDAKIEGLKLAIKILENEFKE